MNWVDGVIIVVLVWFTFSAFSAGIIREIVTMTGVALGIVLAGLFYKDLASDIKLAVDNQNAANLAAFLTIFGACFLAGQLAGMLLKQTASLLMLGTFDHLLGAAFGLVKGLALAEVLLIVLVTFPAFGLKDTIRDSLFGPMFLNGIPVLLRILPVEFKNAVNAL
jgi:membrane protein required for colicin V production